MSQGEREREKKYLVIVVTTEVRDRKEKNRASLCEGKEIVCGTVYTKGVEVEFSRIFFSVNELLNSVSFCFFVVFPSFLRFVKWFPWSILLGRIKLFEGKLQCPPPATTP